MQVAEYNVAIAESVSHIDTRSVLAYRNSYNSGTTSQLIQKVAESLGDKRTDRQTDTL